MEWLALGILIFCFLVGFILNFFTGFGTLIIMVGAVIYSAMTGFAVLSIKVLLVLGALYVCGEVFESISTVVGTKRMGGSSKSAIGGVVGGLLGALLGTMAFGIGAFPGMLLGLFLGAALIEFVIKKDLRQSVKAGIGSLLGRMASVAVKVVIALTMFVIMALQIKAHWPAVP